MTIDLNLIRKPDAEKTSIQVVMYKDIHETLQRICAKEKIKLTHLLRHLINSFITDYKKKEEEKNE
jgi:regulator of PEP synthase PpsR (kinase-PPPase family)